MTYQLDVTQKVKLETIWRRQEDWGERRRMEHVYAQEGTIYKQQPDNCRNTECLYSRLVESPHLVPSRGEVEDF